MKTPTKAKITLTPPATFSAPVEIHMPGGKVGEIEFKFKHRTKSAIKELLATFAAPAGADDEAKAAFVAPEDVDVIMDLASGWDLDEPFNRETVERMTEVYVGSAQAVINAYLSELSGARVKN